MRCPLESNENREVLVAYIAGKLDAPGTAALDLHLQSCEACREFAAGQKAVWEALDFWQPAPASADFDGRLYQRIEREVSRWDLLVRPLRALSLRRLVPVAAAAAVVIVGGIMLERPAASPPRTASAPVEAVQVQTPVQVQPEQVEHALADMELLGQFSKELRNE